MRLRWPLRLDRAVAVLAAVLLLAGSMGSVAAAADSAFDAANQLYGQRKFTEAAAAYEKLIQSGKVSEALYFNLGNAFYKAGQIGRAVAAYRRAEEIAPRDPDVRANLRFVRDQVRGPTHVPNRWHRWLGRLTVNEWTALAAAAFWICLLSLAAIQFRSSWKRGLGNLVVFAGILTVALAACLAAVLSARADQLVIVTAPEATVRNGPFDEFQTAFTARDGAELEVVDRKNGWYQVRADGGKTGWIKQGQVLLASPEGVRAD